MRPRSQMGMGGGGPLGMLLTYWVKRLMIVTAALSIVGSVLAAWGTLPVGPWLTLQPRAIWGAGTEGGLQGVPALWQLATWVFFEPVGPGLGLLRLLLAIAMYGWFAGSLEVLWGSKRFIQNFAIIGGGAAALTILLGLVWPAVGAIHVAGPWPVMDGLIIAWGLMFPDQEIRLFFVLPVKGIHIVYLLLGFLGLSMLLAGPNFMMYFPHVFGAAMGFVVVSDRISFRKLKLRIKKLQLEQQLKREEARKRKRAEQVGLRVVDDEEESDEDGENGDDKPPDKRWLH